MAIDIGSVVTFSNGEDSFSELNNFTVRNGYRDSDPEDGAGIYINQASPVLRHLLITDNEAERYGGAINIQGSQVIQISLL